MRVVLNFPSDSWGGVGGGVGVAVSLNVELYLSLHEQKEAF